MNDSSKTKWSLKPVPHDYCKSLKRRPPFSTLCISDTEKRRENLYNKHTDRMMSVKFNSILALDFVIGSCANHTASSDSHLSGNPFDADHECRTDTNSCLAFFFRKQRKVVVAI